MTASAVTVTVTVTQHGARITILAEMPETRDSCTVNRGPQTVTVTVKIMSGGATRQHG